MADPLAIAQLQRWREHPVSFVKECLQQAPDPWQAELLEAFPRHQRLAVQACKGPGKTCALSWLVWNFLLTRPHCKVACTSVTGANLFDGLWTELALWYAKSPILQQAFEIRGERIVAREARETWWASARTWPKDADPKRQSDALAGLHAQYILFVLDEAGGIPEAVAVTADAALANSEIEGAEAHLIMAGNPTVCEGPLYRAATSERHLWWRKEISGHPDDPARATRVSKTWARQQIEKYGEDSDYVRINVLGQFPKKGSSKLNSIAEVEDALRRSYLWQEVRHYPHVAALDVARYGDDESVFIRRQGPKVWAPISWREIDLMTLVGHVSIQLSPDDPRLVPAALFVDETGLGAGVIDRLRQLGYRQAIGVNFGGGPTWPEPGDPVVPNRRCEMWWKVHRALKTMALPTDCPELVRDLTAPDFRYDRSNRLVIESKDEMKARGVPSPDYGDALALTFAAPVAAPEHQLPLNTRRSRTARAETEFDPLQEAF